MVHPDVNFKNDFKMKILNTKYLLQSIKGGIESKPLDPPPPPPGGGYNIMNNKT